MTKLGLLFLPLLLSAQLLAAGEVEEGDKVPNLCWSQADSKEVCLYSAKKKIKVLLYTAGYCQSCKDEMPALISRLSGFSNKPVAFFNAVVAGDGENDAPTSAVLKAWQQQFHIPFPVGASPFDAGTVFFFRPAVPTVAVIEKDNTLDYKSDSIDVDEIVDTVNQALSDDNGQGN